MGREQPVTIDLFRPWRTSEGRGRFAAHRRQARLLQVLHRPGDWFYLCGSRLAGDEASTDSKRWGGVRSGSFAVVYDRQLSTRSGQAI